MKSNYDLILEKLDGFIRKYYKNLLIRGAIYATGLFLVFYLLVTAAEYFGHFDTLPRTILFYLFLAGNIYILSRFIVMPLLKLYRIGAVISNEQAAEIIGRHFPDVNDKLLNTLQLKQQELTGISPSQRDLVEASINQRVRELKPVPFSSAINFANNRRHLKYAIIPLALFMLVLFSNSRIITDSTQRILQHNLYFEKEAPFQFFVTNPELKAIQHEDFELGVSISGSELPESAWIVVEGNEYKLNRENKTTFKHLFKNIQKNIRFYFTADGFRTREYKLSVLPNPVLLNFDVLLNYPKYLGKKDETLKNTGDLIVPAGTRISWSFFTQNTSLFRMNFSDTTLILNSSGEDRYAYSGKYLTNSSYSLITANEHIRSRDSVVYSISVIPDLYPEIQTEEKADSLDLKKIYFRGTIKDDYGFSRLAFTYKFLNKKDSLGNELRVPEKSVVLPVSTSLTSDVFFHYWDFTGEEIAPGDHIEYYFEVWDNDGVRGAKSTRSQKMIFKAPSLKELEEREEKNNSKIKDNLEESIKKAKMLQKELNDLNKKVFEKKTLNWEDKKKMQNLINDQKELKQQIEKAQHENQKNIQEQTEYRKPDEQLLEKQQQLEELFKNIMSDEMKELFKELEKLMEKLDKEKVQDAIEKMKLTNKDIEKELDRTLEIFKQLEVEKKMQESIDKLNDLAQRQEELSQKTLEKNADNKALEQKQEELKKDFDELKKDLEGLEKKNSELEEPNPLPDTEQKQQEVDKNMKESSESLQQKKNKNASKSQKDAAQKMKEMEKSLSDAQAEESESGGEDINALREILENLVKLSFDQEALMLELSKTRTDNPQYTKLAQRQKKLQDDSKMIEDSILALSKRAPQIQSFVNREISSINLNMEKAIENMAERQSSEAGQRQQFSMTSINNLAVMLNESLQQMQAQQQSKQSGKSGSCKKPGNKQGGQKKSIASLRQMQQQLNDQIRKLQEQMGKGQQKDGQRNNGGMMGMSEELAKLAAQQEAIRRELQKMANELSKDNRGTGSKLAGEMARQMEETETDLVNKRITQETMRRQQDILTRLLEHEKAERERELDEKRKSEEAKNLNYGNPAGFIEYNRQKMKEAELLKTVPPTLAPFYKNKVTEYFNRFDEKTHR